MLHLQAVRAADLLRIAAEAGLHRQGGVAGAHGMILMGQRGAKQGHNAVAQHLIDRALIAVDGVHHAVQGRIEQLPGVLGVAVRQEFHRAFEVGKQHGDLLALAFEGGAVVRIFSAS